MIKYFWKLPINLIRFVIGELSCRNRKILYPLTKNKYRFFLFKAFYQKGYDLTNSFHVKYVIFAMALATASVEATTILSVVYVLFCILTGIVWFYYKMIEAENEFNNIYNPFVGEMRESIKK